jgi:hypothetical protein
VRGNDPWRESLGINGNGKDGPNALADPPRYKNTPTSQSICLDANLCHYAVFDGGQLQIKSYDELMGAGTAR